MWNRAAEKMFGYSRSEAAGSLLVDLIIPNEYAESLKRQAISLSLSASANPSRPKKAGLEYLYGNESFHYRSRFKPDWQITIRTLDFNLIDLGCWSDARWPTRPSRS